MAYRKEVVVVPLIRREAGLWKDLVWKPIANLDLLEALLRFEDWMPLMPKRLPLGRNRKLFEMIQLWAILFFSENENFSGNLSDCLDLILFVSRGLSAGL